MTEGSLTGSQNFQHKVSESELITVTPAGNKQKGPGVGTSSPFIAPRSGTRSQLGYFFETDSEHGASKKPKVGSAAVSEIPTPPIQMVSSSSLSV